MSLSNTDLFSADDGELGDVRLITGPRPVPAPTRTPASAPAADAEPRRRMRHWPVYDPTRVRRRQMPEWLVSYTAWLVAGDLCAAVLAVAVAQLVHLPGSEGGGWPESLLVLLWPLVQTALGSYAERRLDTGVDEYRRVGVAGLVACTVLAVAQSLGFGGFERLVVVAVPVAVGLSLLGRVLQRRRLHNARRQGRMTKQVVVVGREVAVLDLVRRLRRDPSAGLTVIGVCVPRPRECPALVAEGIAVLGSLQHTVEILEESRADAVLVASASETAGSYLRELAWRLEGTSIEVLVGPGMIEVAPNRLQVRPTTSMPLIHIRQPEFRGYRRVLKTLFDRSLAAAFLVLAAPVFLGIAVAVRATSPGPALFRHRRIGKNGVEFDLLKFRSMRNDRQPDEALLELNEGNAVQFKLRRDPRVTPVGSFLRRYSLDELPQLINVLRGEMSLVGPRPHVTREVEQYGDDMRRRLLVSPGLTGLWQVSGRSDLSWDEAVELDVRYVENWSIGLDLSILARTVRAVLGSSGAY